MSQLLTDDTSLSPNIDDKCTITNHITPILNDPPAKTFIPFEDTCDFEETISTPPKNQEKCMQTLHNTTTTTTTNNDNQSQNLSTPPPLDTLTFRKNVQQERLKHLQETASPPILALSNVLTNAKPDVMQRLFEHSQQHSVESYGNCVESLDNSQTEPVEKASLLKTSAWVTLPGMETEQRRVELRKVLNERQKKCRELNL